MKILHLVFLVFVAAMFFQIACSSDVNENKLVKYFSLARTWGGAKEDNAQSIAVDSNKNVLVCGWFKDTADFDPSVSTDIHNANGHNDCYLVKFDDDGNFLWAQTWGGADEDYAYSVAVDSKNNIFVIGNYEDTVDFDPSGGTEFHSSLGDSDFFLSKFDSDGNLLYVKVWGSNEKDYSMSVAVDSNDDVYLTGWFKSNSMDFDPTPATDIQNTNGDDDCYLIKLQNDGTYVRTLVIGGSKEDEAYAVESYGLFVYIGGMIKSTDADFDPGVGTDIHSTVGNDDCFVAKYNELGELIWARIWGGNGKDVVYSISVDTNENVYSAGTFEGTADFNPSSANDSQTSNGARDAYLVKFLENGDYGWARCWGGSSEDEALGVAVGYKDYIYVVGAFHANVDFDPGSSVVNQTATGENDFFYVKFASDGTYSDSFSFGSTKKDYGSDITFDQDKHVYFCGVFQDTVDFDPYDDGKPTTTEDVTEYTSAGLFDNFYVVFE